MQAVVPWIKKILFFLGPSLILAASLAGEGYIDITRAGGSFGFSIVWVIVVALLYKYAVVDGISRYTLATGDHIFAGLGNIPGPKNWAVIFIFVIYFLEMAGYGVLLYICAVLIGYLLPFPVPDWVISAILILTIVALLFRPSIRLLECIGLFVVVAMTAGVLYLISIIYIPWEHATLPWSYPPVTPDNLSHVISLITSVGSGLTLLFISIWLLEKIGLIRPSKEYYEENLSAIRTGNAIAFLFVGIFSIGLVIIGFSAFEGEYLFEKIALALGDSPFNLGILTLITVTTLYGVVLTTMDGKTRAITRVLVEDGRIDFSVMNVYHNILCLLATIMLITIVIGNPANFGDLIPAIGNIVFAITGFIILYLDFRLPEWARGNLVWMLVMILGSGSFLLIALFKELSFLTNGIPLFEGMIGILFLCN